MLLALFCTLGLVRAAFVAGLHVPLDPNEGWNAYHTMHAMAGSALYPPAGSFLFNNYPPLSFYIVGVLSSAIGDNIVAGRVLSFLATLCVAAEIYVCARRMQADIWAALFAALLFVAGLLAFTDYMGMDDPQLLGHAVALAGLVLLLKEPGTTRSIAGAALLMTVAFFIKHNLVALPATLAVWLLIFDRRKAAFFAVCGVLFALIGLIAFRLIYEIDLLGQLNSPRLYSVSTLTTAVGNWLVWADVSLLGLAALVVYRRDNKFVVFCAIYAFLAILTGVAFAGGAGVDMNIWFDAAIALALGTALTFDRLMSGWLRAVAAIVYVLPIAAGLALGWDASWLERDHWLHPMSEEAAAAQVDIAFLKARHGPALCEMLSLCYWAGKVEEADVFNLGQAYATHARRDNELTDRIGTRRYAVVEFDSLDNFALTPRVKQALLHAYRIDHADDEGVFLVPR
jgi:Dolichyl-phosphate-mannose-protein mannosyltransferase